MSCSLGREKRLRKSKDFVEVFSRGRCVFKGNIVVALVKKNQGMQRFAVVIGKKAGKAHKRNRLKRLIREFYRNSQSAYRDLDLIIRVKAARPIDEIDLRTDLSRFHDNMTGSDRR